MRGGWGGRLGGQWYPLGGGWRGVSGVPCEGGLGVSGVPSSGVWGGGGASGVPCEWGLWEFCCVPDEEGLGVVVVSVLFPGGGGVCGVPYGECWGGSGLAPTGGSGGVHGVP